MFYTFMYVHKQYALLFNILTLCKNRLALYISFLFAVFHQLFWNLSKLIYVALVHFRGYISFHFITLLQFVYSFSYWWTFKTFLIYPYCKKCCIEHPRLCLLVHLNQSPPGDCPSSRTSGLLKHLKFKSERIVVDNGILWIFSISWRINMSWINLKNQDKKFSSHILLYKEC